MFKTNANFLKIIHQTVLTRATKCNYAGIPTVLPSLSTEKPTEEQLKQDYYSIVEHFNHPIFINYVPNYEQLQNNPYIHWFNLYRNRNI